MSKRTEGTGSTVILYLLPPEELSLFTLTNRCEQCRPCSPNIKIELKSYNLEECSKDNNKNFFFFLSSAELSFDFP